MPGLDLIVKVKQFHIFLAALGKGGWGGGGGVNSVFLTLPLAHHTVSSSFWS